MTISVNILPKLKEWFIEKGNLITAWSSTASDTKVASEKLVKDNLDKKIDKTAIKTVVNDTLTNNDVVGGKAVYDEIKKVEAGIPTGMKHTDITDWDTATSGFEKGANKTTTISSDNASDAKYPSEKAVKLAIGDLQAHVEENYPLKTSVNADLNTKIDKTSIKTGITNALTNEDVVGGKALYDEIQAVKTDIPTSMTHTQISDWATATNGFEKGANKATSLSSPDDTKYPTTKAVSDGLSTKIDNSSKTTELSNTSSDTQIPSAKAVYDLYSTIPKWNVQVVSSVAELPTTGTIGTIYLIKGDGKDKNNYDEYFWNDASDAPGYEKFGGIDIDLTGFVKMPEIVEYIKNNGSLDLANDGTLSLTIN